MKCKAHHWLRRKFKNKLSKIDRNENPREFTNWLSQTMYLHPMLIFFLILVILCIQLRNWACNSVTYKIFNRKILNRKIWNSKISNRKILNSKILNIIIFERKYFWMKKIKMHHKIRLWIEFNLFICFYLKSSRFRLQ